MNSKSQTNNTSTSGETGFALVVSAVFFAINLFFALRHVMWRDEWMPLAVGRFTSGYGEFFEHIRYIGRIAYFSLCWALGQLDSNLLLFKLTIVLISSCGVFILCRYSPLTRLQKVLFSLGYYPLYEYGTILRDYSIVWVLAVACCALLNSAQWRPLLFGITLALLFSTNPFGLALGCALGATYAFDAWQSGRIRWDEIRRPAIWGGVIIASASFAAAIFTMIPPSNIAEIVLGQPLRQDSHLVRLMESLPFPFRGWVPIPLFGTWNSQILDPFPWVQIFLGLAIIACALMVISQSRKALFLFAAGMLALGAVLCHLPWTSLRYHGPYYILLILCYWSFLRSMEGKVASDSSSAIVNLARKHASGMITGLLAIHTLVSAIFLLQEQVIPFSGSKEAAEIIRRNTPPDSPIVGDPDYLMIPLAGYLDRQVYIASRKELGSFTKVDTKRRSTILQPSELSEVISEQLAAQKRDIVLVTGYAIGLPPEMGRLLATTRSITDEHYFIYLIYNRSPRL